MEAVKSNQDRDGRRRNGGRTHTQADRHRQRTGGPAVTGIQRPPQHEGHHQEALAGRKEMKTGGGCVKWEGERGMEGMEEGGQNKKEMKEKREISI